MNIIMDKTVWRKFLKLKLTCGMKYTDSQFLDWLLEIYTETIGELDD